MSAAQGACQLCTWVPVNCWSSLHAECQKRRVFQSLFPEMAQQAELTGQYSCFHTLGSFGQLHKLSQVIMWSDGVSLHSRVSMGSQ